ncbi:MAG: polysaccharide biosynthesis/export family protein [Cyclobacteriaceae bacterium]|nr:polysaccharide biosynthesis/export family protein [Cytophagales bacterium]MCZ8327586.1 polysaccharide biosynthesis/export family protein [Cyclobacteriaceae bacterium]
MSQSKNILIPVLMLLLLASCVPNRKILNLQKGDVNKNIPKKDTILRTYDMVINEYKIQPLDMLNIQFETLSEDNNAFDFLDKLAPQALGGGGQGNMLALNGIFVNPEGYVAYPVLGKIKVAGLTIFEAEREIGKVAAQYVPDVVVRVRMLNFRFTIMGEVNLGERVLVANNPRLTMMEAIGMAGGLTDLADRSNIKLVRQKGDVSEIIYVNILEEKFIQSPYFYIQQNDVIIIPPLKQRPFRKYFVQNLGILSTTISFAALIITLANNN